MSPESNALSALADSVADGGPIDWDAIESRAPARDKRLIRHLRLVESISTLYRSIPPEEAEIDAAGAPSMAEPAGPRWGRLVLLDQIGNGTSGEVFRAFDTELHREVALKLLRAGEGAPRTAHARVLEEARRLARVRHAHVVHVYGAEQHDDRVGLWMELVRGESLEQIVKRRGVFGPREAALIGQDLCAALAAVHAAGLLHRDVKAQNVLRENGGRIVLMDFGTGEEVDGKGGASRMAGTPLYLAPEIFRGEPASPSTDLYSLGVLLYYSVTGEFPVSATTMEQLASARANRQMRRLRDVRPDLPAPFVRVVERALEHDPAARYRTAGEMEAALREAVDGFQPHVVESPGLRPTSSTRRPALVASIAAMLVVVVGLIIWSSGIGRAPAPGKVSIAVLPLQDLSGSAGTLADGLTDELIGTLGQLSALRVKSRTSIMQFRDTKQPMAEIAKALKVDTILEGTVATETAAGNQPGRVRVNVRLISAGTDSQLWSRTFERPQGNLLALQSDIARAVVASVNTALTPAESKRLAQIHQTNAGAEAAVFEGRVSLGEYGVEATQRALAAFQRAVQLDSNNGAAHAGAARAFFTLGFRGVMSQPAARASALAEAQRAIELDENLPDAHATLADLKFYYDWDWAGAEQSYRRSIELNSSYTYGRSQYAQFLAAARRLDEAVRESFTALELDPLSADAARIHGLVLYYKRDYTNAKAAVRRALDLERDSPGAWAILGRIAEATGRLDEAVQDTNRALELSDGAPPALRIQAMRLQALTGNADAARSALALVHKDLRTRQVEFNPHFIAYVSLALGDYDTALTALEDALGQRQPTLLWLAVDPRMDPIRNDPRFQKIVRTLGLN